MFVALSWLRFGFGVAAAWFAVSLKKASNGQLASLHSGGARSYVVNGTPREVGQGIGGRKFSDVMEEVCNEHRSKEVAPEVRAETGRGCLRLKAEEFAI